MVKKKEPEFAPGMKMNAVVGLFYEIRHRGIMRLAKLPMRANEPYIFRNMAGEDVPVTPGSIVRACSKAEAMNHVRDAIHEGLQPNAFRPKWGFM